MVHCEPQHWIFAYGSLMWDPGFPVAECVQARVEGYARRFCLQSVTYRGTIEDPGLVLALEHDQAAHCVGLALRVAEPDWPATIQNLRLRELDTGAYSEEILPLALLDGRHVNAVGYVMRQDHEQYVGGLTLTEQARIIARAVGGRGSNRDYLLNTTRHLQQIGVDDHSLFELAHHVETLANSKG